MSIDTLADHTEQPRILDATTPAVRSYLQQGIEQVSGSITVAEQRLNELDRRRADVDRQFAEARADTEKHLAGLMASRTQLVAFLGGEEQMKAVTDEPPTFVCPCGRIAVVDQARGPVHDANGTHVPAGEECRMPILGDVTGLLNRAAGEEGPAA
ncbi:hypothetical protein FAF44_02780 [Nonomuraea sp. MG754425]|uniref:hypothetical protein n=1 Tax=Nonomuraea sp. MG754425 TaxID=2570319 RepID=UPI001F371442|nr:hypothetical protein [Nonomuraea sp. MG754425]MCF6467339.1 hypothetical protein [Nonomuraea sp. MG754425]